jgi:hypothetical protein
MDARRASTFRMCSVHFDRLMPNKSPSGRRGRPPRAALYERLDGQIGELRERLGGLPSPLEADGIWRGIWLEEAHHCRTSSRLRTSRPARLGVRPRDPAGWVERRHPVSLTELRRYVTGSCIGLTGAGPQHLLYFRPDPHQHGSLRLGGHAIASPSPMRWAAYAARASWGSSSCSAHQAS